MGLRFRKSFKLLPGVKINLNKKSAGITFGTRGAHYTINTSGRKTASVGLPGTGLSYSTSFGGKKKKKKSSIQKWIGIVVAIAVIVCVAFSLKNLLAGYMADHSAAEKTVSSVVQTVETLPGAATDASTTVWISGSGKKYHTRSDCSGMEDATAISLQEALDMGKEPCKRCAA